MSTLAAVVIQDLTFTETQLGLGLSISYTNGATAGAEVVTADPQAKTISIQIESGVSTATQIRAAFNASTVAVGMATCTVSGTGSNAQVTCKNATLSGGTTGAKATFTLLNGFSLEAVTGGTAGNDLRFKLVAGGTAGAEAVTVSTNDISVEIEDGVSTWNQIRTALHAESAFTALASVRTSRSFDGPAPVEPFESFANFTGGTAAAAASVVVQDLTFAGDVTGTAKNDSTISYTTGATAGAEVVSVSGQNVNVQIQNGVSTATQIATAFAASAAADGVAASGIVTVVDYTKASAVAASGTVTVADYTKASAVAASGTVTVVDYAALHGQAASLVVQDLTYTALASGPSGNAITVEYVDGGAIGDNAIVECDGNAIVVHIDDTAVTGTSANTVKAAVNADPEASLLVLVTGAAATVQALEAEANLEDGQNPAVLTVNGTALTEGTDWDAATDNDTTAADLETAIEAVTNISSSATGAAITVSAAATGTAGNAYTLATSDAVNLTISGATLTGGRAATTVTINGTALVANVDWTAETSNDQTAINLEAAIEAVTNISSSAASAVITVSAAATGTAGNAYTLATSNTEAVTVSGATLTNGRAATTVTINGTALVANVNWTAETNNATTATNLEAAIEAVTGINSSALGAVITVVSSTEGTAGNAYTLATSNSAAVSVGAATLSGGTDAWACTVSGTGSTAQKTVNGATPTGAVGDGAEAYFKDESITALTASFVAFNWDFNPTTNLTIHNDETSGVKTVIVSFDGVNTHSILAFGESLVLSNINQGGVFLKYGSAAPAYRLSAVGH